MFGSATFAIVVSITCISVASMIDTTSSVRRAGSGVVFCSSIEGLLLAGASSACSVARGDRGVTRARAPQASEHRVLGAGVDAHLCAHAGAQGRTLARVLEREPHRDALHDLHPVAGGILRRQQRELGARGRA